MTKAEMTTKLTEKNCSKVLGQTKSLKGLGMQKTTFEYAPTGSAGYSALHQAGTAWVNNTGANIVIPGNPIKGFLGHPLVPELTLQPGEGVALLASATAWAPAMFLKFVQFSPGQLACPWGPYMSAQGCAESCEKGLCASECLGH